MNRGTGRTIFWSVLGVVGVGWAVRKAGIRVPVLNG